MKAHGTRYARYWDAGRLLARADSKHQVSYLRSLSNDARIVNVCASVCYSSDTGHTSARHATYGCTVLRVRGLACSVCHTRHACVRIQFVRSCNRGRFVVVVVFCCVVVVVGVVVVVDLFFCVREGREGGETL